MAGWLGGVSVHKQPTNLSGARASRQRVSDLELGVTSISPAPEKLGKIPGVGEWGGGVERRPD